MKMSAMDDRAARALFAQAKESHAQALFYGEELVAILKKYGLSGDCGDFLLGAAFNDDTADFDKALASEIRAYAKRVA